MPILPPPRQPMKPLYEPAVSALTYSLVRELCSVPTGGREAELNRVVEFVLGQRGRMPDLLGCAMIILTIAFNLQALLFHRALFNRLPHEQRWEHIMAWKNSLLGPRRDLIRFYESLAVLGWYSFRQEENA